MYVDDLLVFAEKPKLIMDRLADLYTLKEGSVHEPDTYLSAQFSKFYVPGGEQLAKP